tara:strand:- start:271 stop:762 length:492 start_codon:yes stop_codon:yes gene_type:complete
MGSDSDLPTMKYAVEILEEFEIETEVYILSAHRTPIEMMHFAKEAEFNNINVIIAGAGGAAHLPGMIAALTIIPVIGVPVESKSLKGIDSLLSIVQMPAGVPVATVAINGSKNAGLLAAQIVALSNHEINQKLKAFRKNIHNEVNTKNENLKTKGINHFLEKN